ncbi:MAG: PH domain-containing protein, partial [Pseudohongiella sp.]
AALLLAIFWVPKRFRLTGYSVQPQAVYFRTGALWRVQTVVTLNRIQHVEITQGPLERWLKLARLIIYTAGGKGSDLTVPGLPLGGAESIRDGLLRDIDSQYNETDEGSGQ